MSTEAVAIVALVRQRITSTALGTDRNLRPTGPYTTQRQKDDALELALAWLEAADDRRITMGDLDMVSSLTATALDAVRCRDRRLAAASDREAGK